MLKFLCRSRLCIWVHFQRQNTHHHLTTSVCYKKLLRAGYISRVFFSLFYWYPAVILFSLSVLSSSVENSLIRSYKRSFNGFAANLTANERQKLASEYSYINYCLQHPKEKLIYSDCSNDKSISFEL